MSEQNEYCSDSTFSDLRLDKEDMEQEIAGKTFLKHLWFLKKHRTNVLDCSDSSDFSDKPIIIVISSISPIKTKSMFF
jgi:hypothetical protein